jgi:hypothetical protein
MGQDIACTSDKKERQSWCSSAEGDKDTQTDDIEQPSGIGVITGGIYEKEYGLSNRSH